MAFDLASAEPVSQAPTGFDLSSAEPVDMSIAPPRAKYGSFDVLPGGKRVPTGSPEALAARSPVAGNSFLDNATIGVGKLYTDALLAGRQMYAQARGQDPNAVVDPVTEQTSAEKRTTMRRYKERGAAKLVKWPALFLRIPSGS